MQRVPEVFGLGWVSEHDQNLKRLARGLITSRRFSILYGRQVPCRFLG